MFNIIIVVSIYIIALICSVEGKGGEQVVVVVAVLVAVVVFVVFIVLSLCLCLKLDLSEFLLQL